MADANKSPGTGFAIIMIPIPGVVFYAGIAVFRLSGVVVQRILTTSFSSKITYPPSPGNKKSLRSERTQIKK